MDIQQIPTEIAAIFLAVYGTCGARRVGRNDASQPVYLAPVLQHGGEWRAVLGGILYSWTLIGDPAILLEHSPRFGVVFLWLVGVEYGGSTRQVSALLWDDPAADSRAPPSWGVLGTTTDSSAVSVV